MGKSSKYTATVSLAVMGAGFLATLPIQDHTAGYFLQGAFEAGLVGGLADWFAVTALFRHPLGIPIPHTALLPNNRHKMTEALVNAVQQHLLNKKSITDKVAEMNPAQTLLQIAAKELHSPQVADGIASMAVKAVQAIPIEEIVPMLIKEVKSALTDLDTSALLAAAVEQITVRGYEEKALDYLLDKADVWVGSDQAKEQLGQMAETMLKSMQGNGIMQFAVNAFICFNSTDKIGGMLQGMLLNGINQIRLPGHPFRDSLLGRFRTELLAIGSDHKLLNEIERLKMEFIAKWDAVPLFTSKIELLRTKVLQTVGTREFVESYIIPAALKLIEDVQANAATITALNGWIQEKIASLLEQNHDKIGQLVRENLEKMNNKELVELIEDKVGSDLQWIRVNGAVCGFAIGLVLTAIRYWT